MAVPYNRFYDEMQSIIDSINHDSDPAAKLANLQRLQKDFRKVLLDARDAAAYELRSNYSSEDSERLAGVSRQHIDYWARRWMDRTGSPSLRRKRRVDLSNVLDLSGVGRFPFNPPR